MLIGYARVSTQDQNLALQRDALTNAGCEKIYSDKVTSAKANREGLDRAMEVLRPGDTLVVWKLDRLGRSLSHLVQLVNDLKERGIEFKSLRENIDTSSGVGKLVFHIFASLAEFERDLIRERTMAGLESARARGRMGGRPKSLDEKKAAMARSMHQDKTLPVKEICAALGVSKTTFYRYVNDDSRPLLMAVRNEATLATTAIPHCEGWGRSRQPCRQTRADRSASRCSRAC